MNAYTHTHLVRGTTGLEQRDDSLHVPHEAGFINGHGIVLPTFTKERMCAIYMISKK